MKKILLLISALLALSFAGVGQSKNIKDAIINDLILGETATQPDFYTSASGSGSTCSQSVPCSISTALSLAVNGDVIGVKGGDTYEVGELVISDADYIIEYGSGDAIFKGSVNLTAATWTSEAGGFYSTPVTAANFKWLYINDQAARYGQSPFITCNTRTANTNTLTVAGASKTTVDAYNAVQSLVGAKIRMREWDYRLTQEYTITNYNTGTGVLTFDGNAPGTTGWFFLYGQAQFCTLANDFYYNATSEKLFVKSASSPAGSNIRYGRYNNAFTATAIDNVTVRGLTFMHYQTYALDFIGCNDLNLLFNTIQDVRGVGMRSVGDVTGNHLDDNVLTRIGLNAIEYGGFGLGTINRNTISYVSRQANLGWPVSSVYPTGGTAIAGVSPDPANGNAKHMMYQSHVEANDISYTAYQGIGFYAENSYCQYNRIDNFNLNWVDGGGIHTFWASVFDRSCNDNFIRYNTITNGVGGSDQYVHGVVGVYIDNRTQRNTVESNYIYNCTNGGVLLNFLTTDNYILNNNLHGNGEAQVYIWQHTGLGSPSTNINNVVTGNVMVTTTAAQRMVYVRTDQATGSYNPFSGTGASQNIYVPFNTTNLFTYLNVATPTNYTFSAWQTLMGKDAASTNLVTARKPYIATNHTNAGTTFTPSAGDYTDIAGTPITSLTLSAYSSQFYLSLDPDYKAITDYSTSQGFTLPTTMGQRLENERVIAWKASGFWAAQDVIYCTKTLGDRGHAKVNWKAPGTRNMVEVGTLTYTSNLGFKSDGTTGYLNTQFIPSTHGVNYTLNSAMVTFVSAVNEQSSLNQFGASSGVIVAASVRNTSDQSGYRVNHVTSSVSSSGNSSGYFEWRRTASNALSCSRNGVVLGTASDASTGLPPVAIYVLAVNAAGTASGFNASTKDVGMFAIGAPTVSGYPEWLLYN